MAFIGFVIVGGLGFVINAGITLALIYFGISPLIARVPAILFAIAFTWLANRRITFNIGTKPTGEEVIRYLAVAICMACFNYLLFTLFIMLNLSVFIAITFATAIQTMLSFYGYKKLVFKQINEIVAIQKTNHIGTLKFNERQRISLWIIAFVFLILNFVFKYPGEFNNDSSAQYAQALLGQYSDWHPPVMAWVWSRLLQISDGPVTILTIQLGLHWLGFAIIADTILCLGRPRSAWLTMLCGAFPVFLFYNGQILKDVGMASTMLVAFGLGFRYRVFSRTVPLYLLLLSAILLAYGTLVRTNAIFAFGPLFIYLFAGHTRFASVKQLALLSILLASLALPISNYINHNVLGAKRDNAIQSLLLFDLNGIAYHSSDLSVLPPEFAFTIEDLQHCYTPYWWDTISPWGSCSFAWDRLGPKNSLARKNLGHRWITEVVNHPFDYAIHRFKALNSMLYFLVPAKHCRYALGCGPIDPQTHALVPNTDLDIGMDYVKKSPLSLPINWLVLGLVLLLVSGRIKSIETQSATRTLLLSGVLVLLFMLIVGVASDIRYAYWSIMSIMLAAIISFSELRAYFQRSDLLIVGGEAMFLLTVLAGLLSRFFNFTALI
jgi:putative flippase GtrA